MTLQLARTHRAGTLVESAVQPDGKILALVGIQRIDSMGIPREAGRTQLIRLDRSGKLDRSFGSYGRVKNVFGAAEREIPVGFDVADNGAIVVAGLVADKTYPARTPVVAKFWESGRRVRDFGSGGIARFAFTSAKPADALELVSSIQVADRGGVLVAGGFPELGKVARLGSSGQLDNDFGIDGVASIPPTPSAPSSSNYVSRILVEADGSYLAIGSSKVRIDPRDSQDSGFRRTCLVAKFDARGGPVLGFGTDGQTNIFYSSSSYGLTTGLNCTDVVKRSDQSLLLMSDTSPSGLKGTPYQEAFAVTRDGVISPSWPPALGVSFPDIPWQTGLYEGDAFAYGMVAGQDESAYVNFAYQSGDDRERVGIVRLSPSGVRDKSFGTNGVAIVSRSFGRFDPATLTRQSSRRLLVGGITDPTRRKGPLNLRFAGVIAR